MRTEAEAAMDRYFRSKAASVPGRMEAAIQPLLDRLAAVEKVRVGVLINVEAGQQVSGQGILELLAAALGAAVTPTPQKTCETCGYPSDTLRHTHGICSGPVTSTPEAATDGEAMNSTVTTPALVETIETTRRQHELVESGAYARCSCGVEFYFQARHAQYQEHREERIANAVLATLTSRATSPSGAAPSTICSAGTEDLTEAVFAIVGNGEDTDELMRLFRRRPEPPQ